MCINALCCSGRAVPLFWSALDFAAEFRKIGRNEGDFGGYLPLHLPQSLPLSIKVHFVCSYHNSMSINIKIVQRKDKTSKSNAAPIHIRFTLKGKVRYLATGIVLPLDALKHLMQIDYLKGIGKVPESTAKVRSSRGRASCRT